MMRARNDSSGIAIVAAAALVGLAMAPGLAPAQDTGASGWLPWMGCWVEVAAPGSAPMTCVVPTAEGGAALLTVEGDEVTSREALRADGREYAVEAAGCRGVEVVEPSPDGARLYTRTTLRCEGGNERVTRGVIAMVSRDQWIRVRAMTVGGGSASWTERYRPAPAERVDALTMDEVERLRGMRTAVETARMAAAAPITVDAIIEATARTNPEAVRAWVAERGDRIRLDADALVRLADAGVPEEIIDVAIAVSYPDRFAVERQPEGVDRATDRGVYGRYGGSGWDRYGMWTPWGMWPGYYDPFYARYGYSRYGYSPYGYGRWGSWGYGYGTSTVIVVRPVEETVPRGRMVRGQGHTGGSYVGDAGRAVPRSRGSASVSRPSGSSSATVSRGSGARSGSSGSKAKAKPKNGGGGGG